MGSRLAGKVAFITGAASGIGFATAGLFAKEGASVVVCDVDQEKGTAAVERIQSTGGKAILAVADVSFASQVEAAFRTTDERFGGLDVLVNNAYATFNDVSVAELREDDWDRTIAVCLKGPFLCTRAALPRMRAAGRGSIIWISSVNALFGVGEPAYTAAKGGMISLARLIAAIYGEWGIRSNAICPGTIATESCMAYWNQFPAGKQRLQTMYPLGRFGQPEEVANCALFLASEESAFITGAVHVVDGGLLAGRKLEEA
jgi:3-oxoacyl-[acyl-carrier protein] reductase